jgi:hypothetical protein
MPARKRAPLPARFGATDFFEPHQAPRRNRGDFARLLETEVSFWMREKLYFYLL